MVDLPTLAFWLAIALIVYAYIGFSLLIIIIARFKIGACSKSRSHHV
ncbi:hypothetical protein L0337_10855 [candidate division KSB1 bacterium]|nr:hypothetical protein [candidate division KSB1 bacterium]